MYYIYIQANDTRQQEFYSIKISVNFDTNLIQENNRKSFQ